ncbi:MAG TPA: twin-arginine translocase TatA/TatE family subunit [Longimicrobium sp.]|jgi:TatA/E family protein of Tat protein translocase|nr:twin-arginine translocase TatA/TatE family subunit [Longimicrobium sp.]
MPFGLGFGETLLILAVILLFFGPKRLPDAAASMGKGIREFRRAMSGIGEELTAPQNTAAPPLPPHSTLAGTGADPNAVAMETPAPPPPLSEPLVERRPEDPAA